MCVCVTRTSPHLGGKLGGGNPNHGSHCFKKALFSQKHVWGKVFFIAIVTPMSGLRRLQGWWGDAGRLPRGRPLITSSTCSAVAGSLGGRRRCRCSRGALRFRSASGRFLSSDVPALILSAVGDPRRRLGPLRPDPDGDPRQPG